MCEKVSNTWHGLHHAERNAARQAADGPPAHERKEALPLPKYQYTLKHRWSIRMNFLSGLTLVPWLTLLWRHGWSMEWLVYPHRIIFLTLMAVLNSVLALFDWVFFSRAVAAQPLHPEPVFILGHPRTGTTHLHNLLSTDPRFAFATTFHAGFPSTFLFLEPVRGLLRGLLERRRPMDNMALDWDLPAEDEIAVNVLTGGDSPYMALVLPRLWRPLLRSYLTFGAAADSGGSRSGAAGVGTGTVGGETPPGGVAGAPAPAGGDPWVAAAFQRWLAAFMWFMKKVTYRHVRSQRRRRNAAGIAPAGQADGAGAGGAACGHAAPLLPPPLLIKSPVHTARLAIWRRLFPAARYVFVHRHPVEVFQSAANMADTYYWFTYLQRPTNHVTNDFIMDQYDMMYESYLSQRRHIPEGRLVEVSFAELDSDPLGVLRRIYRTFGWDEHFAESEPRFQRYLEGLADFKKNHFNKIDPGDEAVIRERWRETFEAFGYQ